MEKLIINKDYFKLQWNIRFEPHLGEKLDSTCRGNGIIGGKITNFDLKEK